ncbi:4674_t:CDS:2, partial [Dentiscutata heterogama]
GDNWSASGSSNHQQEHQPTNIPNRGKAAYQIVDSIILIQCAKSERLWVTDPWKRTHCLFTLWIWVVFCNLGI